MITNNRFRRIILNSIAHIHSGHRLSIKNSFKTWIHLKINKWVNSIKEWIHIKYEFMQNKHITLTPLFGMLPSATSKAATSSSDIKSAVPKKTLDAADSTKAIPLGDNAAVSIGTMTVAVTSAMARLEDGTVGKVTSASAASSSAAVTAATDSSNNMPLENNHAFAFSGTRRSAIAATSAMADADSKIGTVTSATSASAVAVTTLVGATVMARRHQQPLHLG
jgi:hypothetical protein